MSQEIRRRLAARERLSPPPRSEADIPEPLQIRRFSQGLETAVLHRFRQLRVGRFSTGAERLPANRPSTTRIGRFSRGQDHIVDDAPEQLHVGRYADSTDSDAA